MSTNDEIQNQHDIYYLAMSARYWSVCVGVSLWQKRKKMCFDIKEPWVAELETQGHLSRPKI